MHQKTLFDQIRESSDPRQLCYNHHNKVKHSHNDDVKDKCCRSAGGQYSDFSDGSRGHLANVQNFGYCYENDTSRTRRCENSPRPGVPSIKSACQSANAGGMNNNPGYRACKAKYKCNYHSG